MGNFFMFNQVIEIEDQKAKDTSQCEIKRSVPTAKNLSQLNLPFAGQNL